MTSRLLLASRALAATLSPATAADPIRIGVPVGLSGANSVVAPSVVQSAELAVEEINAKGGVLGHPLALDVADDGSGAAGAQKAFAALIFQKKVNVLTSMETSAARNAGLPIAARGARKAWRTKKLRAAGVNLPYGNLAVDEGTAKSMGADATGIYISASYVTGIDTPANKAFLAAMSKKFGADLKTPNDLSVPEYEAVYAYKAAVEKAGGTDPAKVLKALAEVSGDGPRGSIKMDKQRP